MPPNGNRALHDGVYRMAVNGIVHWYRVAGARPRSVPLVIIHGGPGGTQQPRIAGALAAGPPSPTPSARARP
jgi:proline iminopeptidase